jgi:sugar phosphate isomerase/epimerase
MSVIVLLDDGPLGMVTNPKSSPENEACKNWLASLAYKGIEVVIPEIADYEVRRDLLRAGKDRGIGVSTR